MKKRHLIKVRRSRKTYLFIYLMSFFLIFFLAYLYLNGYALNRVSIIVSVLFIFFSLKYTEFHRISDWWAVTEDTFIESRGLFNKNVREVGFSSISDFDIDQPFFKRILNYGNVNVRLFLNDTSICIRDINDPSGFLEKLKEIINSKKVLPNASRKF